MSELLQNAAKEVNKKSHTSEIVITSAIFFILITALFVFTNYKLLPQLNPFINSRLIFGQVAVIIVLSLTVTYFYAYKFFNQTSYLLICLGWCANAIYLLFEFFFNDHCSNAQSQFCSSHANADNYLREYCRDDPAFCLNYSIQVYLFSLTSSVLFCIAARQNHKIWEAYADKNSIAERAFSILAKIPLVLWLGAAIIPALLIFFNPEWEAIWIGHRFALASLGGMIFTAYALIYLGYTFHLYLSEENKSDSENKKSLILWCFPFTLYAYGAMQFSYPFKIHLMQTDVFAVELFFTRFQITWLWLLFVTASILKLLNIAGLMILLLRVKYHDYIITRQEYLEAQNEIALMQNKLLQRNNLATLGVLSASIEHDLKTPLTNLETDIDTIKKAFSNNDRLLRQLKRLEDDKNRIFAVAKVIPFIRSSGEFYKTEKYMDKISVTAVANLAIRAVKSELNLDTEKFFFRNKNNEYYIRAFSPMIEQIFANMFKNGIEAIRETGRNRGVIDIEICLVDEIPSEVKKENKSVRDFKKWVRVDISDNGCGIAEENLRKLTTLYTSKDKPNGGIGLYIAKRLLKIHDAAIFFQSKVGEGTTCSLFFPEWSAYKQFVETSMSPEELNEEESEDFADVEELETILKTESENTKQKSEKS